MAARSYTRFLQVQNKLQTEPQNKVIPLARGNSRKLKCQARMQAGPVLVRSATPFTPADPSPRAHNATVQRWRVSGTGSPGWVQNSWKEQSCTSLLPFEGEATHEAVSLPTWVQHLGAGCAEQETAVLKGTEFIILFKYKKSMAASSLQCLSVHPVAFWEHWPFSLSPPAPVPIHDL